MLQRLSEADFHKIWSHRWLNPKTMIKPSPICATGVFAKEKILKGEIVRVTGGIVLPKADVPQYNKLLNYVVDNIGLDVNDDFVLAPTPDDLGRTATINHSCEPNVGFLDSIIVVAIKDIEPGEEVAWDYAFSQTIFEPFTCNCRTAKCRKTVSPSDWQLESIQKKYGQYYSPYLKQKLKS